MKKDYGLTSRQEKINVQKNDANNKMTFNIFVVIFVFLLVIALIRKLSSAESLTFTGFLEMLSNAPQISFDLNLSSFQLGGNWGIFDFLRSVINIFGSILGFIIFLIQNLINFCSYLIYFIEFIFV